MKTVSKFMSVLLIMSIVLMSCNKDDDDVVVRPTKLNSVKYTPNKIDAKQKIAFSSKNAILNPARASVTFKISKATKDKKNFVNPKKGGFMIGLKGMISAPKDHTLEAGTYVITVAATTKKDKKNKKDKAVTKITTFTVVIAKTATSKLFAISYSSNKLSGKLKAALKGENATIKPKDASVSFGISKITKDKKSFTNPKTGGFKVDSKGTVVLAKDHKLGKGTYELTITATDKGDKKNKKNTKFTVVIS